MSRGGQAAADQTGEEAASARLFLLARTVALEVADPVIAANPLYPALCESDDARHRSQFAKAISDAKVAFDNGSFVISLGNRLVAKSLLSWSLLKP